MVNKLILGFIGVDFVFLLTGALMLGFALISENQVNATATSDNVVSKLLLGQCPLTAAIVNAIFIFITFLISLPALVMQQNKSWLRVHGWATLVCALFTLILGLVIWFDTLQTRSELLPLWSAQPPSVQSLLQNKFNCCGYLSPTQPHFVVDQTCPKVSSATQAAALSKPGCVTPFSNAANAYLDVIFTGFFGIAGLDAIMIMFTVMVLKYRHEQDRYRAIDDKNGHGAGI